MWWVKQSTYWWILIIIHCWRLCVVIVVVCVNIVLMYQQPTSSLSIRAPLSLPNDDAFEFIEKCCHVKRIYGCYYRAALNDFPALQRQQNEPKTHRWHMSCHALIRLDSRSRSARGETFVIRETHQRGPKNVRRKLRNTKRKVSNSAKKHEELLGRWQEGENDVDTALNTGEEGRQTTQRCRKPHKILKKKARKQKTQTQQRVADPDMIMSLNEAVVEADTVIVPYMTNERTQKNLRSSPSCAGEL